MRAEIVRVGDVLRLERRPIDVDPWVEYREIGVRSFGKGIFHKEPVTGDQIGNKRVFRIEPGDLVLSNVFAWEGAVSLAADAEMGMIGSHRFMTYVPRDERILPAWAASFFVSEAGLNLLGAASPGSAGRNRTLAIKRFEDLEISLPPLEHQRLTVRRLALVNEASAGVADRAYRASELVEAAQHSLVEMALARGVASGWELLPLPEVATINPRRAKLEATEQVAFVPMAGVDAATGTVANPELRTVGELGSGYKQFAVGDVIFARITPCMQNGKCAIYEGPQAFGYGSTEFHVVRAGPVVDARWLHRVMRSAGFRQQAALRFKGTAGQQRVPVDFLESVVVPIPPPAEQGAAVAALDRIERYAFDLASKRSDADELISALGASARNREFTAGV